MAEELTDSQRTSGLYTESLLLDMTKQEHDVLVDMARQHEMSVQVVMRQALRLYQLTQRRLQEGETLSFSGDEQRARDFAEPLAGIVTEADTKVVFTVREHDEEQYGVRDDGLRYYAVRDADPKFVFTGQTIEEVAAKAEAAISFARRMKELPS